MILYLHITYLARTAPGAGILDCGRSPPICENPGAGKKDCGLVTGFTITGRCCPADNIRGRD